MNRIDACLSYFIQKYPSLLLIGPVKRTKSRGVVSAADQLVSMPANSLEEVNSVPEWVHKSLTIMLRFLSGLMENSSNKSLFNSVEELVDLLAAADDNIAAIALEVLCALSTPPALHKQQAPEIQQHSSALHSSRTTSHKRLVAMARGWGTRGSGLGLFTCCTADDSEFGQGALPQEAGELHFSFFRRPQPSDEKKLESDDLDESLLVELSLQQKDIIDDAAMATEPLKGYEDSDESSISKQKRRRVAPVSLGEQSIRSTPDLFFECLEKAGGRDKIPEDRIFPLLSDIRLARSFHCRATRIAALERRLRAITTILNAHPSQEIMSGYFQAQPELCVELIDLLRPTVSSASVSTASTKSISQGNTSVRQDAISALANSPTVPYQLRELSLQALTALVGRRDGTTGALTGVARHSNVLSELGVGKGQYLGLLPTLIRFSLASLTAIVSSDIHETTGPEKSEEDTLAFEIGLAFVQATMPPPLPRNVQLTKALEFIDSVLTLTSAVVSTQSGTSALTECGLIPALLATVAVDHEEIFEKSGLGNTSTDESIRITALLRFVTAQAIQIIEGAIVTQSNALSAFHDLNGVEVLTRRLSKEIRAAVGTDTVGDAMDCDEMDTPRQNVSMASTNETALRCSQRVLLFSIVTCLTVVFHQESTSSSISTPSGSAQLRKPDLTEALITILNFVDTFGGHLVSLIATLLADVMNSDPHVVRHVHDSGLAKAFLALLPDTDESEPLIPPVPELIMALPSVLSALALTEDGANAIKEVDPFPALLRIFYHPKYAMPRSRCLLNEMTAIVGTGLEEIVRHISILKPLVCTAIANAMNKVAEIGENLALKEKEFDVGSFKKEGPATDLENERSCLMQYALNFGQLLEQILHNEDHCQTFVSTGGLDALLRLQPCLMPTGREFLSHICCLSCPSVSTISHSATEDAMTIAFRCIALRYDSFELLKIVMSTVSFHLDKLTKMQLAMRQTFPTNRNASPDGMDATFVLDGLPREAVFELLSDPTSPGLRGSISDYLRQVVTVQWVTCLLSSAIKAACQRSQEIGGGWSRQEREWKKELSSTSFESLMSRLCKFHQSAIFESCRVRTEDGFEQREEERRKQSEANHLRYRLRIVNSEGAVVRDGIEIDSCASVGNMEMGEISDAFDRCVNSSGVMRYRTSRGWVSEQTRGHGREPIAEVLSVWEAADNAFPVTVNTNHSIGRIEAGVPDIKTTSASILARLQTSYSELFSALSKVVLQGVRGVPTRNLSFQQDTIGAHVATLMKAMTSGIKNGFNLNGIQTSVKGGDHIAAITLSGISMYLGCMLSHLRASLFDEKRDRRTVNLPLLIVLYNVHEVERSKEVGDCVTMFDAIHFVFEQAYLDFNSLSRGATQVVENKLLPNRRQSRTTAASLPAALAILKRLMSGPSITSTPASSVLSRLKESDLASLLGEKETDGLSTLSTTDEETFTPETFFRKLLCTISNSVRVLWNDNRLVFAPPYVIHPIAMLVSDVINGLEESSKSTSASLSRNQRDESGLWNAFRGLVANRADAMPSSTLDQDFEPSEDAVTRLMEMGFSRDHAWVAIECTRSNQLEIAMEHALSHPPPSPSEVERRRSAADDRRRQREQRNQTNESSDDPGVATTVDSANEDEITPKDTMEVDGTSDDKKTKAADFSAVNLRDCLDKWKLEAPSVSCDILAALDKTHLKSNATDVVATGNGDGDLEALTVVLTSFLLDICQRYPDLRDRVANELFQQVASQITERCFDGAIEHDVTPDKETSFSALCHAAVLFSRALPKTRIQILQNNLVGKVLSCIETIFKPQDNMTCSACPAWLAPSLLLLDLMAQPIVAFNDAKEDGSNKAEVEPPSDELQQVQDEHKKQADELSTLARDLFLALDKSKNSLDERKPNNEEPRKNANSSAENERKEEEPSMEGITRTDDLLFKTIPAYFPLLPLAYTHRCVDICLHVLESAHRAPGVIHGTLLLLLRLLRSPGISSFCVRSGLAEKIFALPRQSRFTGHCGLVTLIYRRLLEDESTLQASMETEIRGAITKLHGKKSPPGSDEKDMTVSRKAFVQAITPLLCREPFSLLKAVAVTVLFEHEHGGNPSDGKVTLLSPTARSRNLRIVSDALKKRRVPFLGSSSYTKSKRSSISPRSKTPVRSNKRGPTPKRGKKEKHDHKDKSDDEAKSPASFVTNLIINYIINMSEIAADGHATSDFGYESSFIWAADALRILSDLVFAIPACATTIHRFRLVKSKSTTPNDSVSGRHARSTPKTFVSFLLHSLLVQDRSSCASEYQLWEEHEVKSDRDQEKNAKKQEAFRRTQISQAAAKLLFALVARPGEGRRRVIAELAFVLSGGLLGSSGLATTPTEMSARPRQCPIHALHAWGELCIGLAAPRNSGNNYDGDNALSFEVIRIMLDVGVAHALLIALHRVPLSHPRASSTLAALILPFEVLSRPTVTDATKELVAKEISSREVKGSSRMAKFATPEQGKYSNDSFADDHMLEDAFAMHGSQERHVDPSVIGDRFIHHDDLQPPQVDAPHEEFMMAEGDPDLEEVEIRPNHMEIDEELEEDDGSDEEMSSSDESEESSDEEDDEESDEDEDDEEDDDEDEDDDSESIIEDDEESTGHDVESEIDFNADYNDDSLVENPEIGQEDIATDHGEAGMDDGWTRIDSNGFGGMVLGGRRGLGQQLGNTSRTRGFIDAAEAMIGTLLRTGEIHGDALAEIEGSLGIRIMHHSGSNATERGLHGNPTNAAFTRGPTNLDRTRADILGTLPQIHQRQQPDVGYSGLGEGRRWSVSSMEYVYGGPSVSAGSRNYDLIPRAIESSDEVVPTISQIDAPLFPGGPASVAHSSTQHALHPLLCGVDLPPINSLVSDLLPHGVRETQRGQPNTRSPGDWTNSSLPSLSGGGFLVSTSNGHIVRTNRGGTGLSLAMNAQPRTLSGPVGWSDDGLPFDATVEEFSSAFERAIADAMAIQSEQDQPGASGNPVESPIVSSNEVGADTQMAEAPLRNAPTADTSDGDGVASSLAAGLRLSPHEGAINRENDPPEDVQIDDTVAAVLDGGMHDVGHGDDAVDLEDEDHEITNNEPSRVYDAAIAEDNAESFACPPDVDPDVFLALPPDMQREVVEQARATADVASQLDSGSSLDPETLAALPEDVRREVIEQEQRERRMLGQAPADPANAQEMDNASFVASLAPDLREEILLTVDDAFLQSLPVSLRTEAQILRERASVNRRSYDEPADTAHQARTSAVNVEDVAPGILHDNASREQGDNVAPARRKQRTIGKMRVESDRTSIVYLPTDRLPGLSPPVAKADLESFLRLLYLLSPVRPQKLVHKVFQNMSSVPRLRQALTSALINLLHDDNQGTLNAILSLEKDYEGTEDWRWIVDTHFGNSLKDFPPPFLIGAAPEVLETDGLNPNLVMMKRKQTSDTAASIAANLPMTARGSRHERYLPPVVATRIVDTLQNICKNSPRFCINILVEGLGTEGNMDDGNPSGFDKLLDLLEKPRYTKSSANLEQLLVLLESAVSPLSNLPRHVQDDGDNLQPDLDAGGSSGKEWVDVPRIVVSQGRLQLLCSILRMETCRETSFAKVNTIARRLCRIDANRGYILAELASVARALGADAIRDLKALSIRMSSAIRTSNDDSSVSGGADGGSDRSRIQESSKSAGASNSVAVSTSTSELKLLRVLQTLQALCTEVVDDTPAKKDGNIYVTDELVHLLRAMELDDLWTELSSCLKIVQVLEGVKIEEDKDSTSGEGNQEGDDDNADGGKKLQNSVAGLLTRFLPSIESFFVANASASRTVESTIKINEADGSEQNDDVILVGGNRLFDFVTSNRMLLNALVRNNSSLLDKGLRALVHVPRCRHLLDFDVKRHWFKAQVRRLRQHANRRHGSLRLHINRKNVLIDAYHQLRLRNADEMRGRLHITFRDEQGVDAGGLSREFFGILAKEIFNPNYALFTSTEDGSTFQPNPNSNINPDHLSYFRFVGRIVGKAVLDGYLLDAHFTRSLYKHMLGIKPTHHDMEAIDPDYYKNLKTILEYDLGDLGLELTFSIDDHSFGRSRLIDLIPNGRNVVVTEENKAKYVSLVCQHRMTTAISSQINAYLDGFYELVSRDLISIFTPRELELLISGLPDIDVQDLKQNTDYIGWKASDQQIEWFWNVLFSLSRNQKAAFLQFVTGSSKVPLAGFGELPGMRGVQKFSIHKASGSAGALMSAHTCFNSLDLPVYNSEEELREKLLYAITEGGGTFLLA